jgi:ATP-dependent Clp protease protease subunit
MKEISHQNVWDYIHIQEIEVGVVRLSDDINSCSCHDFSREISFILSRGLKKIQIIITSPGGGAYHAFAIYDIMQSARSRGVDITGIVEGFAASAASMIVLQGCDNRLATKHSRLHLHEMQEWVFMDIQSTSKVEDRANEMKALEKMVVQILSGTTKKSEEEISAFIKRRERWMSAQEALEFGLIDEII